MQIQIQAAELHISKTTAMQMRAVGMFLVLGGCYGLKEEKVGQAHMIGSKGLD